MNSIQFKKIIIPNKHKPNSSKNLKILEKTSSLVENLVEYNTCSTQPG